MKIFKLMVEVTVEAKDVQDAEHKVSEEMDCVINNGNFVVDYGFTYGSAREAA